MTHIVDESLQVPEGDDLPNTEDVYNIFDPAAYERVKAFFPADFGEAGPLKRKKNASVMTPLKWSPQPEHDDLAKVNWDKVFEEAAKELASSPVAGPSNRKPSALTLKTDDRPPKKRMKTDHGTLTEEARKYFSYKPSTAITATATSSLSKGESRKKKRGRPSKRGTKLD
jgi:hypothetical protein